MLTGNVVVAFDRAMPVDSVLVHIGGLMRGEIIPPGDANDAASWHRADASRVAASLGASPTEGISSSLARERLAIAGSNAIPTRSGRSDASILFDQFKSLPVGLLAAASVVSIASGAIIEAAAILGVVALNAAIGYLTESRAQRTIRSLGVGEPASACVIRDGAAVKAPFDAIVPGDLLMLSRGTMPPADARLISARDLTVSEAALTGESAPVLKTIETMDRDGVPLGDRRNMVYRGTIVTGGAGTAIVVATGAGTQVGRIRRLVDSTLQPKTPMQRQLDALGRQVIWLAAGVVATLFGLGWLRGFALLQVFRSGISLAVAAVPEGLPALATLTLALGIEQMRRRNVLIRRLDAVETLAVAKVVCFDKTGTLTRNEMRAAAIACGERTLRIADAAPTMQRNPLIERLLSIGVLCSEADIEDRDAAPALNGSSTEIAVIQAALDRGVDARYLRDRFPRLTLQHRTEAYRFMVTTHDAGDGRTLMAVKGSPLEVLERCRWEALPDGTGRRLTDARRSAIERINAEMAEQGLRVLGFADRELNEDATQEDRPAQDLTWVGLVGMVDPIRDGMTEVVHRLHGAGLRTVMMTGDQSATARAIANQLGLGAGAPEVIDAAQLDGLSAADTAAAAKRAHVFARVSPEQKLRIIRALQDLGDVVAMIGDGVNDSPALRAADIGIALGQAGASAARDVADVVLGSDDLSTLLVAIEQGRTTYKNVRKAIHYLLGTNLSEILLMIVAAAAGAAEALSPMQLLWINLVSDVLPGVGLALEPPEPGVMEQAPMEAGAAIVGPADLRPLAADAAILSAGALGTCAYGALRYGFASGRTRAMTFNSLVAAQLLHALTCRSGKHSVFGRSLPSPNPALTGALALTAGAQAAAFAVPGIRRVLGLGPLGLLDAGVTIAGGVLPFLAREMLKVERGPHSKLGRRRKLRNLELERSRPPAVIAGERAPAS